MATKLGERHKMADQGEKRAMVELGTPRARARSKEIGVRNDNQEH
jgi:hypothetical protein